MNCSSNLKRVQRRRSKMKRSISIFIFFLSLLSIDLSAQQNITMHTGNVTMTGCNGNFFDDGGNSGNYSNNANDTLTICPGPNTGLPELIFTSFNLGAGDIMEVYQGTTYNGQTLIGTFDQNVNNPGVIQANPNVSQNGCLTIVFTSNNSNNASGWIADINCYFPCQQVIPTIANTFPDSTGGFIDICQEDTVDFIAGVSFPENDTFYHQSASTTSFYWYIDSTNNIVDSGQVVQIPFDSAMGQIVGLIAVDSNGCSSTLNNEIPVRVSTTPHFDSTAATVDTICFGESFDLEGNVEPVEWSNATPTQIAGTTYLPDGSGVSYSSTLTFNDFAPGATVSTVTDIIDVWLDIEHSYLGDLEIEIICPNNQSSILKPYPGGGGTWLGEPCDNNTTLTPGNGYIYSFPTVNPTYGTMLGTPAVFAQDACTNAPGNTLPAGSYTSNQPLTNLVGCPLNGTWQIQITDNLFIDNGFIFAWGINFQSYLYPSNILTYEPGIDSLGWIVDSNYNDVLSSTTMGDTMTVEPTVFDTTLEYTLFFRDSFDCTYDTTVSVFVRPPWEPVCCEAVPPNMTSYPVGCPGDSTGYAVANPVDSLGPAPWWYTWTDQNGDTIAQVDSVFTADTLFNLPQGQYTVEVRDSIGCFAYNNVQVNEVPPMQLSISDIKAISCAGNFCDGSATVNINSGGTSPYSFLWSNGDTNQIPNSLCSDTNTVFVTDARGCLDTIGTNIPSPDSIDVVASGSDTICISNSTPISAQATGGNGDYVYNWTNTGNGSPLNVSPIVTTTYEVVATDSNNCPSAVDSVTIYVRDSIRVNLDSPDTICPGDTALILANTTGGDGNFTYNWENGWGSDSLGAAPLLQPGYVDVAINDGCGSPTRVDSVFIQVGGYDQLKIATNGDDTICFGESAVLSAQGRGGDEEFTYVWDNGLDTGKVHAVVPQTTTTYNVTVSDNCLTPINSTSVTITVGNQKDFDLLVDQPQVCKPGEFKFAFDTIMPDFNYEINFGDGYRPVFEDSIGHTFQGVGCYDIKARIYTDLGCLTQKTFPCLVEVLETPIADFSFDPLNPTILDGQVNFINKSAYSDYYKWFINDSISSQNLEFAHLFADTGRYAVKLIAENENGCVDSTLKDVFIDYKSAIWIPNAFTPNGDGINDTFLPKGDGLTKENYSLYVYNRWGNVMWSTNNPNQGWDGIGPDGKPAQNGSYVYDISYMLEGGREIHERGEFKLIR